MEINIRTENTPDFQSTNNNLDFGIPNIRNQTQEFVDKNLNRRPLYNRKMTNWNDSGTDKCER